MKKVIVEFEYDDDDLGPEWFNIYNLELLLYGMHNTKRELLKINKFKEE